MKRSDKLREMADAVGAKADEIEAEAARRRAALPDNAPRELSWAIDTLEARAASLKMARVDLLQSAVREEGTEALEEALVAHLVLATLTPDVAGTSGTARAEKLLRKAREVLGR